VSNRLSGETSPYLLQHAENPVEWHPWGEEALKQAREQDRPIFLSIGYAACHWCHVMAHESFEDLQTAAVMNRYFVNIKVDREERPDLDSLYMDAIVAMTGQGGWPMSVFLTPTGEPFYGGTYFPPTRRHGLPSFRELLLTIAQRWREDRQSLLQVGAKLTEHLSASPDLTPTGTEMGESALDSAAAQLLRQYDWTDGGWGQAPKFPQPLAIEFLLRLHARRRDQLALDMALHALAAMARGGLYDLLGGGFHRYCVDSIWQVPHFEKMLYDNAQLAQVYLHAWQLTSDENLRRVHDETVAFLLSEMRDPEAVSSLRSMQTQRVKRGNSTFGSWKRSKRACRRSCSGCSKPRPARAAPATSTAPTCCSAPLTTPLSRRSLDSHFRISPPNGSSLATSFGRRAPREPGRLRMTR